LWIAHVDGRWSGVQFRGPDGQPYESRLDTGRIGSDLHDFLLGLRGFAVAEGWKVWVPLEWRERQEGVVDGTFRVLCFRDPLGNELSLEFHYRRPPVELLEVLERLATTGATTRDSKPAGRGRQAKEPRHADRKPRQAAVPAQRRHAEAEGAGLEHPQDAEGGQQLRWREAGRA
jgi:hypothetical protein